MTLEIKLSVLGQKETAKSFKGLATFFRSGEFRKVLEDAKTAMIRIAQKEVPKKSRFLKSAISGVVRQISATEMQIRVGVRQDVKYARAVEFGTRPHAIVPRERQFLAWERRTGVSAKFAADENLIFKKIVQHPGTKAQPYLRPALRQVQPRLFRAIQRVISEKMKG